MCLYVENDYGAVLLGEGERTARVEHQCTECNRAIEPGERYRYWTSAGGEFHDGVQTEKMCAHCWGTIELGSALTGCPKAWNWEEVHNHQDEDVGFVGNILWDEGHNLTRAQRIKMLRTVAGRRRKWRRGDGSLLPVPALAGDGGSPP